MEDYESDICEHALKNIDDNFIRSSGNWGAVHSSTSAGPAIDIPTWLVAGGIGLALGLMIGGD
jgi:hypothetical protein